MNSTSYISKAINIQIATQPHSHKFLRRTWSSKIPRLRWMFGTGHPCPKIPSSTWNRKQHFQLDMPQCGPRKRPQISVAWPCTHLGCSTMRNAHRWETPNLDLTRVSDGILLGCANPWWHYESVTLAAGLDGNSEQTETSADTSAWRVFWSQVCDWQPLFKWTSWFCLKHVATSYH